VIDGFVIESNGTSNLRQICQLAGESSRDFEKSRNVVWRCYIGDFRNIALNDRLDVGTVPVLAPPLATALDSVRVAAGGNYL
jgi:hypothetical protein